MNGLLATLCAIAALSAAALVLGPRHILAHPHGGFSSNAVPAGHPSNQALIDELASLVARSVGVLGIHHRSAAPYEEIVLWLDDEPQLSQGRPDEREVAVMSHSRVMRTVTIYRISGPGNPPRRSAAPLGSAAFCEALRADPRCGAAVIATGVTDMRVETVGQPQQEWAARGEFGALQRLRLTLTWAPDSADGPDEASVLVDTVLFASGAPE